MNYGELMISSFVMNHMSRLQTEFSFINFLALGFIFLVTFLSKDPNFSRKFKDNVGNILFPKPKTNRIIFRFKKGEQSTGCKALLHYLNIFARVLKYSIIEF